MQNAHFESADSHFWRKSRGKCSFWKLARIFTSLVENACFRSLERLDLEAWSVAFGESLVENARFGSGESLVEKVFFGALGCHFGESCKKLVLESWILTFGG